MSERSSSGGTPPAGWSEVTDPEGVAEEYDPRTPSVFEFSATGVAVHVVPAEPDAPHADRDAWRVVVVRAGTEAKADPFAHRRGKEAALLVATAFMQGYVDRADLPDEARVEVAIDDAKSAEDGAT